MFRLETLIYYIYFEAWRLKSNIKKSKVSGTSPQEAKEITGNVDGCGFLTWLTPFIAARKTKSNVNLVQENGVETEYAFREEDDEQSQDLTAKPNLSCLCQI